MCRAKRCKARRETIKGRIYSLAYNAKVRSGEDVDRDYIKKRLEIGLCEATGLPFNFSAGYDAPTLDQIEPGRGYNGNMQVVLKCYNVMKNNWGEEKILIIADAIRARQRCKN